MSKQDNKEFDECEVGYILEVLELINRREDKVKYLADVLKNCGKNDYE